MTSEQKNQLDFVDAEADARRERMEALIKAYERRIQLRLEGIYKKVERKRQKLRDQIERARLGGAV